MKNLIIIILISLPLASFAQLTGYWKSDKGGCYQIRQDGNEVWWAGESPRSQRPTNVFHGVIAGNNLTGLWCDLPSNSSQGCRQSLSLRLENNNRMVKVASSAPYNGSVWTRQNGPCTMGEGEYWEVTGAEGWTAIWTRRGNSNVYDGLWTGPRGQKGRTVIEITITGNRMTGVRTESPDDGILCDYTGEVSSDGLSVKGTGSCTTGSPWNWSAVIRK